MTDDLSKKREEITFVLMFLTKHCSRGRNKTPLTEFFSPSRMSRCFSVRRVQLQNPLPGEKNPEFLTCIILFCLALASLWLCPFVPPTPPSLQDCSMIFMNDLKYFSHVKTRKHQMVYYYYIIISILFFFGLNKRNCHFPDVHKHYITCEASSQCFAGYGEIVQTR